MVTTMIDVKRINSLNKWYDSNSNYPFALKELTPDVMECLGNNESEIIEFIRTANHEQLEFLSMFTEEILARFPDDKMDNAIDIIISECFGD